MYDGVMRIKAPIRWGMVGGGKGGAIGYIHRSAALRDRSFELLAAAFDIIPERGVAFGLELGMDEERLYPDYATMFAREAQRPDGIQAVSIATPNGTHYAIAKAALESGLHVICEKPLCFTTAEAEALLALAREKNKIFGVTYGYAGHQMILQARAMVRNGDLGKIRLVHMEFAHGGNALDVEKDVENQKWRVDPKIAGPTFVLGDLGTHPLYLAEAILPDMEIDALLCYRQSFIKSRAPLEDNAYTLMKYRNGAVGHMWVSAVNIGSVHGEKIRIVGDRASIAWWTEHPNQLEYAVAGEPLRILERGQGYLYPEARVDDRIGGGHAEGLFESWSNLYYRYAVAIDAKERGDEALLKDYWYPDVKAGVLGVRWLERCVESAEKGNVWVKF